MVSIGLPVYNGERFIERALNSLLAQSFKDFELIISDNASTDCTEKICRKYKKRHKRIKYIRHLTNMGAENNFKFVLERAKAKYFMWAAADDLWEKNFISENFHFLENNKDFVGSISNSQCHSGETGVTAGSTKIEDNDKINRIYRFLKYPAYNSRFYSLFRCKDLKNAVIKSGMECLAYDWIVIIYLLNKGKLNCIPGSPKFIKSAGTSLCLVTLLNKYNYKKIENFIPFYELGRHLNRIGFFKAKPVCGVFLFLYLNLKTLILFWIKKNNI